MRPGRAAPRQSTCSSSWKKDTSDGIRWASSSRLPYPSRTKREEPTIPGAWFLQRRSIAPTENCWTATRLLRERPGNSIIGEHTSTSRCTGHRHWPSRVTTKNCRQSSAGSRRNLRQARQRSSRNCAQAQANRWISEGTTIPIRQKPRKRCGPAELSIPSWIRSRLEGIELPRIHHKHLPEGLGILVCRRPDPEVSDVAVVGHLVRRIASAGEDDGVHIRPRAIRAADHIPGKLLQQRVRKGQDDRPVLRARGSRVAVR